MKTILPLLIAFPLLSLAAWDTDDHLFKRDLLVNNDNDLELESRDLSYYDDDHEFDLHARWDDLELTTRDNDFEDFLPSSGKRALLEARLFGSKSKDNDPSINSRLAYVQKRVGEISSELSKLAKRMDARQNVDVDFAELGMSYPHSYRALQQEAAALRQAGSKNSAMKSSIDNALQQISSLNTRFEQLHQRWLKA